MLRRPFVRFALALAIISIAVPAFALDSRAAAPCDAATTEPVAACDTPATDTTAVPHPGTSPARSKYVHAATSSATGGGSDGEDGGVVHNSVRSSKWHSYLPGMFR